MKERHLEDVPWLAKGDLRGRGLIEWGILTNSAISLPGGFFEADPLEDVGTEGNEAQRAPI